MALANDDDVIKAFPSDRADQPLRISKRSTVPRQSRIQLRDLRVRSHPHTEAFGAGVMTAPSNHQTHPPFSPSSRAETKCAFFNSLLADIGGEARVSPHLHAVDNCHVFHRRRASPIDKPSGLLIFQHPAKRMEQRQYLPLQFARVKGHHHPMDPTIHCLRGCSANLSFPALKVDVHEIPPWLTLDKFGDGEDWYLDETV